MALPKKIQTSLNVTTPAASAAITTANAKVHLKVEHSSDDTYIDGLVTAAERIVEAFTGRVMISTTFDYYLTEFPDGGIVLPVSPVSAITSVKYYDASNVEQTWASTNYNYNIYEDPTVIRYNNDSAPTTYGDRSNAVVVRLTAGYTNAAAIPANLIAALKLKLSDLYENRVDAPRESNMTAWMRCAWPSRVFHDEQENIE